ncbi:MAG: DEAD/DEAH box helicase family protein [Myxococcales bacterium]|nr:DEAD/DEAH box helicase family protein [Myxococcales bacterium]
MNPTPNSNATIWTLLPASSFLERAFLRWVLSPAVDARLCERVVAQQVVESGTRQYRVDYEIRGAAHTFAIELDGFEFHSKRFAFSYDRMRQNDLAASGRVVIRFSYDAIRLDTTRCVAQLQTLLERDSLLRTFLIPNPQVAVPDDMNPDPLFALGSPEQTTQPQAGRQMTYFDSVRHKINHRTLRECQQQALGALVNYFHGGGKNAACVMAVGAGKTALGVVASLALASRRALVVTPGTVIRGTFDKAFDHEAVGNVLYGLPGGPLIPGCPPPRVLTLDRDGGAIRSISRDQLLAADVIITNFHSLGDGTSPDDLLTKLFDSDVDFIVVDEAHIAASDSYQRTFRHFTSARTFLMSACFQRLDGKPIDADVVYRYRLVDSIAEGNAKNLRVHRFAPDPEQTTYEMVWPDGAREEIKGRAQLLELIQDERKLSRITAKSDAPIRQIMRAVKAVLDEQAAIIYPVKPRVLFAALGERHAEQIARIAEEHGIPCSHLHYSMTEARIAAVRARFEQDSGDLQGIVQLKMLGQGYDFPPIMVVVPMRPYGSFSECYQFIGRGIRVLTHPALEGRVGPRQQFLDVIYHAELGLDEHVDTIYRENDMDPRTRHEIPDSWRSSPAGGDGALPGTRGADVAEHPQAFVLFEQGAIEQRIVHDQERVEQIRGERERQALAQRYAAYAAATAQPVTFEQYVEIMKQLHE